MNKINIFVFSLSILGASSLYAQNVAEKKTPPYGDNPNIFKVIAYKTSDAVQNTAQKVGAATENGIRKIKPQFDKTVEKTKVYTSEQATIAKENTKKGIDTAVKKVESTKDSITGKTEYNAPIEKGSLSQSNISNINSHSVSTHSNTNPPNNIQNNITASQNTQTEPEIKRQSIPINQPTPSYNVDSSVPR